MRNRTVPLVLLTVALAPLCSAQSSGSDPNTLAAILAELRSIHQDLRAAQTTQALLVEWQMEQGFVNRAADRVDAARSKLLQVQTDLKLAAAHLSDVEDHLSGATDPVEQARLKEEVGRTQGIVAALTAEEQSCSTALDDQQTKLRNAESDLDSTQDELNALIKRMAPAPSTPPTH